MELRILSRRVLTGVPSASGIEFIAPHYYIVGDNSPWLYQYNLEHRITDRFKIFEPAGTDDIIPKKEKPDFEAITAVPGKSELYIFGSGSKSPVRDLLVWVDLADPLHPRRFPLTDFYGRVREQCDLPEASFNLEAAVITRTSLLLFNRGTNSIIVIDADQFNASLNNGALHPVITHYRLHLPVLDGIQARLSGATYDPGKDVIIFTASAENTTNWIDDGEITGSWIGQFKVADLHDQLAPACIALTVEKDHKPLKIESVTLMQSNPESASLLLVSDDDNGKSELLEAVFFF